MSHDQIEDDLKKSQVKGTYDYNRRASMEVDETKYMSET